MAPNVPLWLFVVAKNPLAELVLTVNVVAEALVVLLPYWSVSWKPSLILVVAEHRPWSGPG